MISAGKATCTQCANGYTVVNGACIACASNCKICDVTGIGKCDVDGCLERFSRIS